MTIMIHSDGMDIRTDISQIHIHTQKGADVSVKLKKIEFEVIFSYIWQTESLKLLRKLEWQAAIILMIVPE